MSEELEHSSLYNPPPLATGTMRIASEPDADWQLRRRSIHLGTPERVTSPSEREVAITFEQRASRPSSPTGERAPRSRQGAVNLAEEGETGQEELTEIRISSVPEQDLPPPPEQETPPVDSITKEDSSPRTLRDLRGKYNPCQEGRRFIVINNLEARWFTTVEDLSDYLISNLEKYVALITDDEERQETLASGDAQNNGGHQQQFPFVPFWVDVQSPTDEDMIKFEHVFHLHPLTTEDVLSSDTGEKWESFDDYVYLVVNAQHQEDILWTQKSPNADTAPPGKGVSRKDSAAFPPEWLETVAMNFLVFDHFILTMHHSPVKSLKTVIDRIRTGRVGVRAAVGFGAPRTPRLGTVHPSPQLHVHDPAAIRTGPLQRDDSLDPLQVIDTVTVCSDFPTATHRHYSGAERSGEYGTFREAAAEQDNHNGANSVRTAGAVSRPSSPTSRSRRALPTTPTLIAVLPFERTQRSGFVRPDWIMYAFLDAMVDMYIPTVELLVDEVEDLDEKVFSREEVNEEALLRRIGESRRNISALRRIIWPKQKLISYLVSRPLYFITEEVKVYLRDVLDHVVTCTEHLDAGKEHLNEAHGNYLARLNIAVSEASHRINEIMKRFTLFTAVLGPMAVIGSFWGMNVKVPGQDADNLGWFFGIVGVVFIVVVLLVILLKRWIF